MDSIYLFAAGYVAYYLQPAIIMCIVLQFFGLKYYCIFPDKDTLSKLDKKLDTARFKSTIIKHFNGRNHTGGLFLCKTFAAYVEPRGTDGSNVYLVSTPEVFLSIMDEGVQICETEVCAPIAQRRCIQVFARRGNYYNLYYTALKVNLGAMQPVPSQLEVIDDILSLYHKFGRASVFIHGVTFAGKSTIGYFVANRLNGTYCHTFTPTDAGDRLTTLINDAEPDESRPLVIVIEEADIMLRQIHSGNVSVNSKIPTMVYNKATWTMMLDDLRIMGRSIVLILTSNTSKQDMDALDPSYLRPGRIHASYSMNSTLDLDECAI